MSGKKNIIHYPLCQLIFLAIACLVTNQPVNAQQDIEQQRKIYLQAQKALKAGQLTNFKNLTGTLLDYPLYPYLIHDYIRPRISSVDKKDIIQFLEKHDYLPVANDLRKQWLRYLARTGQWQTYIDNYVPMNNTELECYQLQARIKTNNTSYLLEDTRSVWLVGKSQPDICDPAFALLYKSDFMTSELIWERIRMSMQNNELNLARYLAGKLDKPEQEWVNRWIATYRNPARGTNKPGYEDTPLAREILAQGMRRLAAANVDTAITRWNALKPEYSFDKEQTDQIERALAIRSVINKHERSQELLNNLDNQNVDETIFHWRLRGALQKEDWQTLIKWTEGEPPEEAIKLRWKYWRARALEQTGRKTEADMLYHELAGERDYYGFLAADKIMADYAIAHRSLPEDLETWNKVSTKPAVERARELFHLGNKYFARREWNAVVGKLTNYELQIAAMIAANWGWHDRTILTLGRAKSYDDLILRFPVVFEDQMTKYSEMRGLDLGWMYALTRAESAFMSDARSPSGALGLMQVMPATGRETAKKINFRTFYNRYLLEPDKNITIGSAYLKQVYERFNNVILATAAYNAGPNAVARWVPIDECMEPDIWVEQIPYTETRKYVARIMFFATIYDWRLKNKITRINQRMTGISPRTQVASSGLSCPAAANVSGL